MCEKIMQVRQFQQRVEEAQNPYTGIVSFQHFRGEALYSDVVVRPENGGTETEDFECYPIPEHALQNGREEGFFPDNSVAYFRILWKEFEPEQGKYNYAMIQDVLDKAKACGQTVAFRLMPHSTRASDDVPEWLKQLIPCPERPDGARVKDSPADPLFLELFGNAIRKIGEKFDKNPVLDSVDLCLPGAWGEGYKLEEYKEEDLIKLVDTFIEVFPNTHLIGQFSLPWLVKYANKFRPIGWRADGTGSPYHMNIAFPGRVEQMAEIWKIAPVSFESYWWLGEWKRQGWDIDEIIEKTLSWHISTFNAKSAPIPYEWSDKIRYWISKMGYHFSPDYFKYPETAAKGEVLQYELAMDNHGVAPIYTKIPLILKLKKDTEEFTYETDVDICKWYPGKTINSIQITLPDNIPAGKYDVEIGLVGEDTPMIYFGTDAKRDGKFYIVGSLEVLEHFSSEGE